MAGPYNLNPGQTQRDIPTWQLGRQTKVFVTNPTGTVGRLHMHAGAAEEESDVLPGKIELDRNFGGAPLTVTNLGPVALTVSTQ